MANTNLAQVEAMQDNPSYQFTDGVAGFKSDLSIRDNSEEFSFIGYRNVDDESLVRLYLEHEDELAFNEIVNRYSCKIYRLALKFTKNER